MTETALPVAVSTTESSTPSPTARTKSKRNGKRTANVPATESESKYISVNILLPPDCYRWYQQQAAQAEFEPTLARYVQWTLRKFHKASQEAAQLESKLGVPIQVVPKQSVVSDAPAPFQFNSADDNNEA